MKKLFFVAMLGIAGVMSANQGEHHTNKTEKQFKMQKGPILMCQSVAIFVWCTGEMVDDTMCWGSKACPTLHDAIMNESHNANLLNESECGSAHP